VPVEVPVKIFPGIADKTTWPASGCQRAASAIGTETFYDWLVAL